MWIEFETFQGLSILLQSNLCAVKSLDKFVAFDTITTHFKSNIDKSNDCEYLSIYKCASVRF
jgi:hypothetical protein